MAVSRSKGEGGKSGVRKKREFGPWKGRLRRRGGAPGRKGALAEEKPVGGKEGKKELRESELMADSRSLGEGGKVGVSKGRLRFRRGGALGRKGALAQEKPVGGKEGKKDTESSDVAGRDIRSSLLAQPQLLPGILDNITLDAIIPKLDLLIVSSVNQSWLEAIYNRHVAPILDPRVVDHGGLET